MGKRKKRRIQRMLCGLLVSAMIATGLFVPDVTAYAAPVDEAATVETETPADKDADGDADDGAETGESGTEKGANTETGEGGEGEGTGAGTGGSGTGEGANTGTGEGTGADTGEGDAGEENVPGNDGEQDEPKEENKDGGEAPADGENGEDEKEPEEDAVEPPMPMYRAARVVNGTLQNGTFTSTDDWVTPNLWSVTGTTAISWKESDDGTENKVEWNKGDNGGKFISLSQTIENIEPGTYQLSVETKGDAQGDDSAPISAKVERVRKSGDSYTAVDASPLVEKKLGVTSWDVWKKVETAEFEIEQPSGEDTVNVSVSFSGTLAAETGIHLASVKLEKITEEQTVTKTLYYYEELAEGDELALYYWNDSTNNISTTAAAADWKFWSDTVYKMTPVAGYAGWYSIPVTFENGGAGSTLKIFSKFDMDKADKPAKFSSDADDNCKAIYAQLTGDKEKAYAIKNYKGYTNTAAILRNITLYAYNEEVTPVIQLDNQSAAQTLSYVDETAGTVVAITPSDKDSNNNNVYDFAPVDGKENWYSLTFSVPGGIELKSEKCCGLWQKDNAGVYKWIINLLNGSNTDQWSFDFSPAFSGKSGEVWLRYSGSANTGDEPFQGEFYTSWEEAEAAGKITLDQLKELIAEAKLLKEEDYRSGWADFQTKLTAADTVAEKEAEATDEEIKTAYNELQTAMDALVLKSLVSAQINVKQVVLPENFALGADLSSYISLRESGVEFKDENGRPLSDSEFFKYLYDGGTNWVRIRVWNDPYDARGNGYGGGNNDLEKAKKIGKLASDAGMKVLIDFHYSDFWADPNKQKAPKAWATMDLETKAKALYDFTYNSLVELRNAGVNVRMVQVGNETNNGIGGETELGTGSDGMGRLFAEGAKAVRAFDESCLVAVHFTDAHKGFTTIAENLKAAEEKYGFTYDVFASSFYPFGHGDTANLKRVLTEVAKNYGKLVMAAETSWPTTLIDGDGLGYVSQPVIPDRYKSQDYGISVQGQADEMRDLVDKVNQINSEEGCDGKAIGVFYWEPAWISPYYIKNEDGSDNMELYKKNQVLWEKYGSGWASSYAVEYDPDDAGVWYGGSAMDHSSWFDFDGTALPTARIYSLIRSGATAGGKKIASVQSELSVKHTQGDVLNWDAVSMKPTARYNDGTIEKLSVTWNRAEKENADPNKAGVYVVHGTAVGDGREYKVTLTLTVMKKSADNLLTNPDFENNQTAPWKIEQNGEGGADIKTSGEDTHNESGYGLHFWNSNSLDFTVSQTVTPGAGTYCFGGFIQGGGADNEADVQYAYVKRIRKDEAGQIIDNETKTYKKEFSLNGWLKWSNPEIVDIVAEEGDELEVGVIIKAKAGAWGTIDDLYLYGSYDVSVRKGIARGTVTANTERADSGDRITVTLVPEAGYYTDYLELDTTGIEWLEDDGAAIAEADGKTRLTWANHEAKEHKIVFSMPKRNVEIDASFESVFNAGAIDLSEKAEGNYLVKVNGSAAEKPIRAQFRSNKAVKPSVKLTYQGYELVLNKDYTVAYQDNNKETTDAKLKLTGKGTKFKGTRTISFEIKKDTRKPFDTKNIKVVFEQDDKGAKKVSANKAVFYLGKKNELTPAVKLYAATDTNCTSPILTGKYEVFYQNNKKIGKGTVVVIPTEDVTEDPNGYREGSITASFTIAKCPLNQKNVTVTFLNGTKKYAAYYTGSKLQPNVVVKYGGETLVKGRDYTLSYSNNLNASEYVTKDANGNRTGYAAKFPNQKGKLPSVKITGKGNFSGTRTTFEVDDAGKEVGDKISFEIRPRELKLATITMADLTEKTGAQAPKITVKDGAKTVAANQYQIKEIKKTQELQADGTLKNVSEVLYTAGKPGQTTKVIKGAGTYEITIEGKEKSNYAGEVKQSDKTEKSKLSVHVRDKNYLIDNAKIKVTGKFYYTGKMITLDTKNTTNPELKVYYTVKGKEVRLKEWDSQKNEGDYTVKYENNVNAGKAEITIIGKGDYQGQKKTSFTISKRTLAKAGSVAAKDRDKKGSLPVPELSFKRAAKEWDALPFVETGNAESVYAKDTTLAKLGNRDMAVVDNQRPSAPLVMPYTGQVMEPAFYFEAVNYSNADVAANRNIDDIEPVLLKNADYTLSYSIGKQKKASVTKENGAAEEVVYLPVTVTLKGRGNYAGSVKYENLFSLKARRLEEFTLSVAPVTYSGKALKPEIIFRENATGRIVNFKQGVAYTVTYQNTTKASAESTSSSQPRATVKVKGNGWVTDAKRIETKQQVIRNFRIERLEITKSCVGDVVFQTFLGKTLKPKVKVKVNGKTLKEGRDYTITYDENIKRGMVGKVTISGKGNYFTRTPIERSFVIK